MKNSIVILMALAAGLSALQAQSDSALAAGSQTKSTQRAKPPLPLVVATLDTNHDGIIDTAEMNNATQALKSLDKNGDGKLTSGELRRAPQPRSAGMARAMKKRPGAGASEAERH